MRRAFLAWKLALAFLTIFRIPICDADVTRSSLADARFAYPVVGALMGLAMAGVALILSKLGVANAPAAFSLIATLAILTGGLHLDGLADSADGLFLWGDRERRLTVMRDPHVGSFGVIALILLMLGKYVALEQLGKSGSSTALFMTLIVSRSLIIVSSGLAPYARPEGTGRIVIEATTRRDSIVAGGFVLVVGITFVGWAGLVASCLSLIVTIAFIFLARMKLGGVTGDILGAVVELSELSTLMTLAILTR